MKMNGHIGIPVAGLFERQFDIEPDRFSSGMGSALIGSLHDTRSTTRDDGNIMVCQPLGDGRGRPIIRVTRLGPSRAENGCRLPDLRHRLEGIHELRHDAENAPGILVNKGRVVAHVCNITPLGY